MSYRLTLVAKTPAELDAKIIAAAAHLKNSGNVEIRIVHEHKDNRSITTQTTSVVPTGSPNQFAPLAERPANARPFTNQTGAVASGSAGVDAPAPKRRGPKSKAEKAAGNAFLGNTQAQVAQPVQAMPTTQFNVGMPQMQTQAPVVQAQTFAPPQATPTPVNGYTFATFKANFIHIINTLANDGRIDESWIAVNKDHFGGAEVHEWVKQEQTLNGLFDAMVEWQLVEKIG